MGFTKPCSHHFHPLPPTSIHSHLIPLTPTHSHPLPPTSIYSHPLPPIPTHSYLLHPPTPIHSHTFPSTPTHSYLLPLIFNPFILIFSLSHALPLMFRPLVLILNRPPPMCSFSHPFPVHIQILSNPIQSNPSLTIPTHVQSLRFTCLHQF